MAVFGLGVHMMLLGGQLSTLFGMVAASLLTLGSCPVVVGSIRFAHTHHRLMEGP